ncbi:MAG: hypothetical protein JWN34_4890 [Bryobacterales bacterium]|nr:hypothetical protein [Bryobacterales bacterium]
MTARLIAGLCLLVSGAYAQGDTEIYYVGLLRPAAERKLLSREDGERLQAAHMAHIRKMAEDGYLVAAGPFEDTPITISGIFILKAASLEEARRIARQDPTIVEKRNTIDVHPWRGPAGIGEEYRRLHQADPKTPEGMGLHPIVFIRPGPKWNSQGPGNASDLVNGMTTSSQILGRAINGMRRTGKLVAGGPVEGEDDLKGILIFDRISLKVAMQAVSEQLELQNGMMKAEYHEFYSAAHVFPW